jgi:beta-N-acetylhexosaminidase
MAEAPSSAVDSALDGVIDGLSPRQLAGQLLVVGYAGLEPPPELDAAIEAGERAGVIVFRRNISPGSAGLTALQGTTARLARRSPEGLPPLVAIDEEGGRVARLGAPAIALPPMRRLAAVGDLDLVERVAKAVGRELRCLGVTMNFAPVVDVDTNPQNPIIGDRAFSHDPAQVTEYARAYMKGLRAGGVASCLKHYPGHGDTLLDSHLALPTVAHDRARLDAVELEPFRQLAAVADSMMTAHVLYPALDPRHPATLSTIIATELLRGSIGFEGVLFSDDLEMRAMDGLGGFGPSAVGAVRAGCDLLLVCSRADAQAEVHSALVDAIAVDEGFRARCRQAARRALVLRRAFPPCPGSCDDFSALERDLLGPLAAELARRVVA